MLAEIDDDLSTLSLPAEASAPSSSSQDLRSSIDASKSSASQPEAPSFSKAEDSAPPKASKPSISSGRSQSQRYPLYPSIAQLLHENGLSSSEADKIPASGPKGRLLKGDVLAYLGRISSSYSFEQSTRITKLGHLDLSNVKAAPPKVVGPSQSTKVETQKANEPETELPHAEIAVPVSLSSVISVQKRIQATLGVTLPLSTFIARATHLANDELPHSANTRPSADELFNAVLGLNKVCTKASTGRYLPQVTALPARPSIKKAEPRRQPDVYDILTGKFSITAGVKVIQDPPPDALNTSESTNVFSVSAARGEEKRARVFLERVKTILQVEPGRLIL